jgi:hypothetical protein
VSHTERVVWKYPINGGELAIPRGSKFLSCQCQGHILYAWFLVDPQMHGKLARKFVVIGTGNAFEPEGLEYLATVQDGPFVWHVFEDTKA